MSVGFADCVGVGDGLPLLEVAGLRVAVRVAVVVRVVDGVFVMSRVRVDDAVPASMGFVGTAVGVVRAVRLGVGSAEAVRDSEGEAVDDGERVEEAVEETVVAAVEEGESVDCGLAVVEGLPVALGEAVVVADVEGEGGAVADGKAVCVIADVGVAAAVAVGEPVGAEDTVVCGV